MSDDEDDERMDRARRIRQMREGRRNGDDASGANQAQETVEGHPTESANGQVDDAAPTDDEPDVADAESTAAPTDTETATADALATDDESAWFDDDDAESTAEQAAAAAAAAAENVETEGESDDSEDDGSTSAAAQAAAAAAQFETDMDESTATADEETLETVEELDETATEPEQEEETRVLEFALGEERYCLDIMYVEEIVKKDHITRVPNTPEFVRGVVDLRGQITTILDPKKSIGIDGDTDEQLIVVFDGDTFDDQGHIGWVVDQVNQVTPVVDSEVKESPIDQKYVNGVIERDDQFVIWTRPEIALTKAQAEAES